MKILVQARLLATITRFLLTTCQSTVTIATQRSLLRQRHPTAGARIAIRGSGIHEGASLTFNSILILFTQSG